MKKAILIAVAALTAVGAAVACIVHRNNCRGKRVFH